MKNWKDLLLDKNPGKPRKVTRQFKWKFAGWFTFLFSLLLSFWMEQGLRRAHKLSVSGRRVTATILEKTTSTRYHHAIKSSRSHITRFYQLVTQYTLDSVNPIVSSVEVGKSQWDELVVGQQIKLIVDPTDPTNVFVGDELPEGYLRRSYQAVGLFLFTALFGVLILFRSRRIAD